LKLLAEINTNNFELKKYIEVFKGFDMDIFSTNNWNKETTEREEFIWNEITV
jgi:hypothetical protein